MKTFASLFSGGGGVDIGAREAGYLLTWGIEYDSDIARVANMNLGNHIKNVDILKCNPEDFECVDWLHASPPCPSFSVAKSGGEETKQDIALSRKTLEFVQILKPRHFTLENVWGYRDSKSWKLIFDGLRELGYGVDFWHINAADYGVPQTRKRMIVIANRDGTRPQKPLPTHRKKTEADNQLSMFEMLPDWISWYEAIEDLIPTLPDSQFAPWQVARLPEEIKESFLMMLTAGTNFNDAKPGKSLKHTTSPADTVMAGKSSGRMKALLLPTQQELPTGESYKAIIMDGRNTNPIRTDDEPIHTLTTLETGGTFQTAFIVDGKMNGNQQSVTIKGDAEPVFCITGSAYKQKSRMAIQGRVVAMTVRCLARWQTFPEWYEFPDTKTLACKIIGNAVPCLLAQRIGESLR